MSLCFQCELPDCDPGERCLLRIAERQHSRLRRAGVPIPPELKAARNEAYQAFYAPRRNEKRREAA